MQNNEHVLSFISRSYCVTMTDGEKSWWRGWQECYKNKVMFYGWSLLDEQERKKRMNYIIDYTSFITYGNCETPGPANVDCIVGNQRGGYE